ncbi:MAG TPA: glycerol-3-phosphate dehydrogenase [Pyrinomonadaceae bacterium]|jgi:glycerol-3-phosphate dehydrogenase|nr:glycerol-3-phosphate dehydrogenase [Pyrinomonadaceae bacterium]
MAGETQQFDVIVIGAGINGAGIARDAAIRGLKVLLIDKGDIGGGTSSWSTRLIHGGLRYLEHGEFGLVRESLRERGRLLHVAYHLVRPLPILVPIYRHARRGWWTMRAGMFAYDVLSVGKNLPRHRMLSRAETLRRAPGLNSKGLRGAAVYFDAQVRFAERLVLENALSAIEHGATVLTYARVGKLVVENDAVCGVEFTHNPQILNTVGRGSSPTVMEGSELERHTASAPIVINAAGPWVDQLLTDTGSPQLIGGTKGSHIIVAPFPGAPGTAIYVEAQSDRRPFFIIPWNRKYLIGTTDIRYQGDLDGVRISSDEIDYLLAETNRVLPTAKLTREQILYTYAGVRPLPSTNDKEGASITRRHFIRAHPELKGLFSIVGGKLTTYRSLAQETVDLVLKHLPQRANAGEWNTDHEPLPGAAISDFDGFAAQAKQLLDLPRAISKRLRRIYGTRSLLFLKLIEEDEKLAEEFDSETHALAAEIVFAFRHELATTLTDCLLRRTMVGLNSTCGLTAVAAAGEVARKYLGWSEDRVAQEIAAYRNEIKTRFLLPDRLNKL